MIVSANASFPQVLYDDVDFCTFACLIVLLTDLMFAIVISTIKWTLKMEIIIGTLENIVILPTSNYLLCNFCLTTWKSEQITLLYSRILLYSEWGRGQ